MRTAEKGGWIGPVGPSLFSSEMMIFPSLSMKTPAKKNGRGGGPPCGVRVRAAKPIAGLLGIQKNTLYSTANTPLAILYLP
jgi:hypothetical protein